LTAGRIAGVQPDSCDACGYSPPTRANYPTNAAESLVRHYLYF
jgi:hypothetical protein